MKTKKHLILILCITILMMFTLQNTGFANESAVQNDSNLQFKDVGTDFWAYKEIRIITGRNIVGGFGDGTFRPNELVTRAQFSKMMVRALALPLKKPSSPSFLDVKKNHNAYTYIETAKFYLTGFKTAQGDHFKPDSPTDREDMAVALVKALGFQNEVVDESVIKEYSDYSNISPNLRKYVAIAVKHGLMQPSVLSDGGKKVFQPDESLTRASTSVLLCNIITDLGEEKITYDQNQAIQEEKVTDESDQDESNKEEENNSAVKVTAKIMDGKIHLYWLKAQGESFSYYKIVISKSNTNPKYPEDGYLYYFSDKGRTSVTINAEDTYNGGDFGGKLTSGEKYYFSVTTVYGERKAVGNALLLEVP